MTTINTLFTLVKREMNDHRVGYAWVPAVILAIATVTLLLALIGIGDFSTGKINLSELSKLGEVREKLGDDFSSAVTLGYWGLSASAVGALPFVIYFTLAACLFDERKDRSILFFKSMPVSDWQEVLAKLVTIGLLGPLVFVTVLIAFQLVYAFILSFTVMLYGSNPLLMWPLGSMISGWVAAYLEVALYFLWAVPVFAWVIFVSSWAPKVPFLLAALPVVALVILELQVTGETVIGTFIGEHLVIGFGEALDFDDRYLDGPADLARELGVVAVLKAYGQSFIDLRLWVGLLISVVFFFGACEFRRRAS